MKTTIEIMTLVDTYARLRVEAWREDGSGVQAAVETARQRLEQAISGLAEPVASVIGESAEHALIIREAECNDAADKYFTARPYINNRANERIFEAGFYAAWKK